MARNEKYPVTIYVDGGAAGTKHVGVAAVARTDQGHFIGWMSKQLPQMTNNEAEYQAAMLGLGLARYLRVNRVEIRADSEVVVRQMTGISRVNSARLKPLHQRACQMVAHFDLVHFQHIKREHNMLADALASEAILGKTVGMPAVSSWQTGSSSSLLWSELRQVLTR